MKFISRDVMFYSNVRNKSNLQKENPNNNNNKESTAEDMTSTFKPICRVYFEKKVFLYSI